MIPIVEDEASFENRLVVLEGPKIWPWFPTGPETTDDCAGEDQQQNTVIVSPVVILNEI